MSIIPLEKLEQLRREQEREEHEERPALHAPQPYPLDFVSGSSDAEDEPNRGIAIIDFTI